ncbi:MAG: hypothetical protein RIS76_3392 [Verrucomicrobiota bacterium]|jgi:hemolysin activation/secretion protein
MNRSRRFSQIRRLATSVLLGATVSGIYGAAQVLPPPPTSSNPANTIAPAARLRVSGFRFEGNHAFTADELGVVTAPYAHRELSSGELEQARRAVTLHYIEHGYVNSGAVIPDQDPQDGVITLRIIEGELSRIDLSGNRWLRDDYINSRLRRWSEAPLNLNELQDGLQQLRQNPNVGQINAELKPGTAPGQSVLGIRVEDTQPFRVGIQFDNQRPPSVGSSQVWLLTSDLNLTGHSDPVEFRYGIANSTFDGYEFSGANNLEGSYTLPFTRFDTTVNVHGSRLNTSLVEEPFPPLAITSLTTSYGLTLRQPLYQTANQEVAVGIGFDRRVNETWLLGEPFNISPGAVDGKMSVSVLRLSQEWTRRGQDHVLALRSTFNVGLDVLDATDNGVPGDPDGKFVSWLGQAQYIQRLFHTQNQLVLRMAGQWTDNPLLALEQLSVGGFESVRGYLENQLVRDRGVVSSAEFRIPVLFNKAGAGIVYLAPFFDFGGAWDVDGSPSPTTIYSTGVGLLLSPNRHVNAQIYWGHRWREVDMPSQQDLQTLGFDFRLTLMAL